MPTSDYIKIDTTNAAATEAAELKASIAQFRAARSRLTDTLNKMNHNTDGTTFTALEALYGLTAGAGTTVYTLVNGTVGAMNGTFQNSNAQTLVERVG